MNVNTKDKVRSMAVLIDADKEEMDVGHLSLCLFGGVCVCLSNRHFQYMKVQTDFKCRGCGACCRIKNGIVRVGEAEIRRIAAFLRMASLVMAAGS